MAPNLMQFLHTCRTLVDAGSICARLSEDLKGVVYTKSIYEHNNSSLDSDGHEFMSISEDDTDNESDVSTGSVKKAHKKRRTTKRQSIPLSLKELEDASDISETEAQKGFLDEDTGDTYYIIEKIIDFHPQKGYLVHWQGYGKKDRTWQKADEMPEGFTEEMKDARDRHAKLAEREKRLFSKQH